MNAFKLLRQHMQIAIANSERAQFFHGRQHVVAAGSGAAVALACVVQLLREGQPSGVLAMASVDDITKRMNAFFRIVVEPDPPPSLAINPSDLFAAAQIVDRFASAGRRHPVGYSTAIAAAIKPEYQAGLLRGSTMHKRINAERAMGPHEPCVAALEKIEARPPHERAVGENPEVLVDLIGTCVHRGGAEPLRWRDRDQCPGNRGAGFLQPAPAPGAQKPHSAGPLIPWCATP